MSKFERWPKRCLSFPDPFQTQATLKASMQGSGWWKWCAPETKQPPQTANSFWPPLVAFDGAAFDGHVVVWALDCESHKTAKVPGGSLS